MGKRDWRTLSEKEIRNIFPLIAHKFSTRILFAKLIGGNDGLTDSQVKEAWVAICRQAEEISVSLDDYISAEDARQAIVYFASFRFAP